MDVERRMKFTGGGGGGGFKEERTESRLFLSTTTWYDQYFDMIHSSLAIPVTGGIRQSTKLDAIHTLGEHSLAEQKNARHPISQNSH
jgi:hypothetical protein